jgi:CBS domain-containing protein
VITVGEHQDLQLCAKLILENKVSFILVVDNNKQYLKGIITKSDLVNTYATYYIRLDPST